MKLEEALQKHEDDVDNLLREAKKYAGTLKSWKKACQNGNVNDLQKLIERAQNQAQEVSGLTQQTASTWQFDIASYLDGSEWQMELQEIAEREYDLRVIQELNMVLSAPVSVKAQPQKKRLLIGKTIWTNLRPSVVAKELKRLREQTLESASRDLLESFYSACQRLHAQAQTGKKGKQQSFNNSLFAKFRDIYDLFCLAPGWKHDNPPPVFAQAIYALHRLRTTRSARPFEFEFPSGNPKERDIFEVVGEDGQTIRYYGIHFR
jgi:hypothetical protein